MSIARAASSCHFERHAKAISNSKVDEIDPSVKRKRHVPRQATPDELREAEAIGQMRLPGIFHDEGK